METEASLDAARFLSDVVRSYIAAGVGLDPEQTAPSQFRLAVVEAVTNVCRHAYRDTAPGPVSFRMERQGKSLVATIRDQGAKFDPRSPGVGSMPRPEDLAEGGYGLAIILEVVDELSYSYDPGNGNTFRLAKRLFP